MLAATGQPGSFWRRGGKVKLHVPAAADITAVSANLLLGKDARFSIFDASLGRTEECSQQRLDTIIRGNRLGLKLREAAELCSAYGDVFLKCRYDRQGTDMPMIDVVSAANAFPEYQMGKLQCIHFFTLLRQDRKTGRIWRVYECYRPGRIETAVYQGDSGDLGREDWSALMELGLETIALPPVKNILATHIVNMRPSRICSDPDKGRSDFEGMRDMLDSLDEIYTGWMRDIRLAKSRLIVPAEFLRRNTADLFRGGSCTYEFDEDVETLVALDIGGDGAEQKITPSQFAIRAQEHASTFEMTLHSIISMSGYSPQTFGLDIQGIAQSGTARRIMEKKSLDTNAKKQQYWTAPLEAFMTAVMHLDRALYGNPTLHDDDSIRVELQDPYTADVTDIAGTVNLLRSARAASTATLVRMLHPSWTEKRITEEICAIQAQSSDVKAVSGQP